MNVDHISNIQKIYKQQGKISSIKYCLHEMGMNLKKAKAFIEKLSREEGWDKNE